MKKKINDFFDNKWSILFFNLLHFFSLIIIYYTLGKNFNLFGLFSAIFVTISAIMFVVIRPWWKWKGKNNS